MTGQTWTFFALVGAQLLGTVTFVAIYSRSDWWATPVGRHLMFFSIAAGSVDLSWSLLLIAQWPWLIYVLFTTQAALAALIWQRVRLVWRAQREAEAEDPA